MNVTVHIYPQNLELDLDQEPNLYLELNILNQKSRQVKQRYLVNVTAALFPLLFKLFSALARD